MSLTRLSVFATLLFSLALFASACNRSNGDDPKEAAEERNEAKFGTKAAEEDAKFLVDIYSSSLMEVRSSSAAKQKAYSQEVKDLAASMESAHMAMNTELQALAATKGVSLPTDLTEAQKDKLNRTGEKTGMDFDEKYLNELIDDHKEAIRIAEKASSQAEDPAIKAFFVNGLPELRHHLDMATALKDRMKDAKKEAR